MPKASKQTASDSMTLEGYEGHFEELGGYTVGFETYTADADMAPLFAEPPRRPLPVRPPRLRAQREGQVHVHRRKRGGVRDGRGLPRAAPATRRPSMRARRSSSSAPPNRYSRRSKS